MKLSQAIREGAKKHPQSIGSMYQDGKTCALGAAYVGAGGTWDWEKPVHVIRSILFCKFPELSDHLNPSHLWHSITYQNDVEQKTREEIADWLERQGF